MSCTGPSALAALKVDHFCAPVINRTMRRESSSALKFKLKRGCGATGDHMPTQPATADGLIALGKFGERGNSEAVWPSSPMPSTTASKGRGTRAKVSQADTAPRSGVGAPFFRPMKRAAVGKLRGRGISVRHAMQLRRDSLSRQILKVHSSVQPNICARILVSPKRYGTMRHAIEHPRNCCRGACHSRADVYRH